jgi:phage-related protein
MGREDKPLVWLHGEVKTPPLSPGGRVEIGVLLRRVQRGESLGPPHSRPMPSIGPSCHELRVIDRGVAWRVIYRVDPDVIIILSRLLQENEADASGGDRCLHPAAAGLRLLGCWGKGHG